MGRRYFRHSGRSSSYRASSYRASSSFHTKTSYSEAVSKSKAMEIYGLAPADIDGLSPVGTKSYKGMPYNVYSRSTLQGIVDRKAQQARAAQERALEVQFGGKEALAAHRLAQTASAAAEAAQSQVARAQAMAAAAQAASAAAVLHAQKLQQVADAASVAALDALISSPDPALLRGVPVSAVAPTTSSAFQAQQLRAVCFNI